MENEPNLTKEVNNSSPISDISAPPNVQPITQNAPPKLYLKMSKAGQQPFAQSYA
jgi:hypothetical protein